MDGALTRMAPHFPELGFYGLAGHTDNPGDLIAEVRRAEEIGLGSVFLSERFNYKDAAVMSGMAAAATTRLGIATAATNHNTRHPLVTMTMASTLHRATGGRFCLGLGRGFAPLFDIILADLGDHEVGTGSGVLNAAQQFSGALGVALIGTVFFQWLPDRGWAEATQGIALVSLACYAVSFLVAFLLPKEAREGAEIAG